MGKELDSQAAEEGPNYIFTETSLSRESLSAQLSSKAQAGGFRNLHCVRNGSNRPFPLHAGEESVLKTHSFSWTVLENHGKECPKEELHTFGGS